ncbi:hypothetical protein BJ742DRAFT_157139 [Cladochytrium replicatum]|nr:hypothetical protein BJ742DRAFT_157139 [Cladochytrium replicatum]
MSYFLESFLRPPLPPPSLQWSSNSAVMTFFALPGTSRTRCVYFVDGYSLPSVISAAADPLLIPDEILLLVYVVAAHDPLVAADSAVESRESVGERGGATPMPPRLHLLNPKSKDELTQLASVHIQSLDLLAPPNVAFVSVGAWAGFDFSTLVRSKRKSMDLQSPATPNPFHSIILHLASTFLGDEERSSLDSMLQKFLERESTTSLPHTPVDLYERIRTAMKDFADESLLISMLINLLIISRVFWVTGKGMYGISEAKALRCVVNVEVVRSLSGRLLHRKFESGGSPSPTMPEIEPSTRAPDEMTKKVEMQPHPVPSNREYSHRQSRTPVEVQRPSPPPQGEPPTSPTLDSRRLTRTPVEIQRPSPPPQGEPPTSPTLDSRRLTRTPVEIQRPSPPPQGEPPTSPTLDSRRLTSQENERRKSRGIYRVESNEDTSGNKRMGEVGNGESRKKVRISDLSVDERNESDQNGGARETMSPLTPKTPKIAYLHQHGVTRGNLVGSQTPENIEARRSTTQNIPPSAMNAPPMQPTSATLPVFVPPPRPSFAPPAFNPSIGFPAPLTLPLTTSTNTLNNFTPSIANTPTTFVAPQAFSTPTITGPHPATSTHVDRLDDFLRRHYPNRDPAEYTTTCLDPAVCALENVVTTVPLYRGRVRAVDQVLESAALFQTPDAAIQDAARLGCNFFRAFYDAARETEKFRPGAQALSQLFVDADDANEDEDEGEDGEIVEGGAGDAGGDENADRGVENLGSGKGAPKKWLPMLTLWAQKRVCTLTFDFLDKEEHAGFVAVVEVEGQKFRSRRAHRKKMDAKEDAAEVSISNNNQYYCWLISGLL